MTEAKTKVAAARNPARTDGLHSGAAADAAAAEARAREAYYRAEEAYWQAREQGWEGAGRFERGAGEERCGEINRKLAAHCVVECCYEEAGWGWARGSRNGAEENLST